MQMSMKVQFNTVKMLRRIFDPNRCTDVCIPYEPQKPDPHKYTGPGGIYLEDGTEADAAKAASLLHRNAAFFTEEQPFARCTPEEQGIASGHIARFVEELWLDRSLNLHSITILRGNKIIFEAAFGDYLLNVPHVCYSLSKSITATAIGMLIAEGRLTVEDRLTDIFKDELTPLQISTHKKIKIRHLLNMTSGIVFNETGSVTETDWVKGFFDSLVLTPPGKAFNYNSMNSFLLSAAVKKITGAGLMEYLTPRLWEPLGIKNVFWELSPCGIEKGGWGLYIIPEDLAKIGRLYLQGGIWKDKRLIPAEWIEAATAKKVTAPQDFGDFNYGYHIWVGRRQHCFLFNGMFGQNMLCFPDTDIVLIENAGNNEMFQQSHFFKIASKYFGKSLRPSAALPPDQSAEKRLLAVKERLRSDWFGRSRLPIEKCCRALNGLEYNTGQAQAATAGLLPLMIQALQNNYTTGIYRFTFRYDVSGEQPVFNWEVEEGGQKKIVPVGFDRPEYTTIEFQSERYLAAVRGRFTRVSVLNYREVSEDYAENDVYDALEIRISYLEMANSRIVRFIFLSEDSVLVCFREYPDSDFLLMNLEYFTLNRLRGKGRLTEQLANKVYNDVFKARIRSALELDIKYKAVEKTQNEQPDL